MTDEITTVDTRMPLALHPSVFAARIPADHQSDTAVSGLQAAHAAARRALEVTLASHSLIMADPTFTAARNLQRSGEAADRRKADALAAIDAAIQRAHVSLEGIASTMARAVEGPSSSTAQALALALRQESPDERRKIIRNALATDEKETLAAIFRTPAWYSGLSPEERNLYMAEYQHSKFPDLIARRKAVEEAISIATDAGTSLCAAMHNLISPKAIAAATNAALVAAKALEE